MRRHCLPAVFCFVCSAGSDTGIDVVPNSPKCPMPVLMGYRRYRHRAYPVLHSGTRVQFNILLTSNSNHCFFVGVYIYIYNV